MEKMSKLIFVPVMILSVIVMLFSVYAQDKPIKAELPVLVTECGQGGGSMKLKVFLKNRLKLDHVYNVLATADLLVARQKAGNPIKSLIIVTGASLKGMGAAGISIDDEIARSTELMAEAKKQGIKLIGAHLDGMARRAQGAAIGDNSDELSIDAICPESALLIIRQDGNEDGRFTTISKDKKIPMLLFKKNMELSDLLKNLFSK